MEWLRAHAHVLRLTTADFKDIPLCRRAAFHLPLGKGVRYQPLRVRGEATCFPHEEETFLNRRWALAPTSGSVSMEQQQKGLLAAHEHIPWASISGKRRSVFTFQNRRFNSTQRRSSLDTMKHVAMHAQWGPAAPSLRRRSPSSAPGSGDADLLGSLPRSSDPTSQEEAQAGGACNSGGKSELSSRARDHG